MTICGPCWLGIERRVGRHVDVAELARFVGKWFARWLFGHVGPGKLLGLVLWILILRWRAAVHATHERNAGVRDALLGLLQTSCGSSHTCATDGVTRNDGAKDSCQGGTAYECYDMSPQVSSDSLADMGSQQICGKSIIVQVVNTGGLQSGQFDPADSRRRRLGERRLRDPMGSFLVPARCPIRWAHAAV